jgi:23S rRNA pseudouridine955/2504/2580 synthase
VKVARSCARLQLLEVTIKTGRTHQIRVHLAHKATRSPATTNTATSSSTRRCRGGVPAARMFLHARRLQFDHPAAANARRAARAAAAECEHCWRICP